MKRILSLLAAFSLLTPLAAQNSGSFSPATLGIVSFKECIEKSKLGQAEQKSFEELKQQMGSVLDKTEKELEELAKKLNDNDYLESLSADAQNELKTRFQDLGQELARYQNQYYQILNQANVKLIQELSQKVGDASKSVATARNLSLVMQEDVFFYSNASFDITDAVVAELDKRFDAEGKTASAKPMMPPQSAPSKK